MNSGQGKVRTSHLQTGRGDLASSNHSNLPLKSLNQPDANFTDKDGGLPVNINFSKEGSGGKVSKKSQNKGGTRTTHGEYLVDKTPISFKGS